jgi:hypothetical protein
MLIHMLIHSATGNFELYIFNVNFSKITLDICVKKKKNIRYLIFNLEYNKIVFCPKKCDTKVNRSY